MEGRIDEETAARRIQKLIAIQKESTKKRMEAMIGSTHSVLVDGASKRDETKLAGKDEYGITVNVPGDRSLIGEIVRVRILSAGESKLRGEIAERQ